MEFHLPEVCSDSQVSLYREKELFLQQYLRLEKQRFLYAVLAEFKSQPLLQHVDFFTGNEGRDLDADLTFSPEFDREEHTNYWEAQSVANAMRSVYVPELNKFCDSRSIKRPMLLKENGELCYAHINDLLNFLESD